MVKNIVKNIITALVIGGMVVFVAGCSQYPENTSVSDSYEEQTNNAIVGSNDDDDLINWIIWQSSINAAVIASTMAVE